MKDVKILLVERYSFPHLGVASARLNLCLEAPVSRRLGLVFTFQIITQRERRRDWKLFGGFRPDVCPFIGEIQPTRGSEP